MAASEVSRGPPDTARGECAQIGHEIGAVHVVYTREELGRSTSQPHAEIIGGFVGRPALLVVVLLFMSDRAGAGPALPRLGLAPFDAAPLHILQGIVALAALHGEVPLPDGSSSSPEAATLDDLRGVR